MSADRARVSVLVEVEIDEAFRIFTEEIDEWWQRGHRYRVAGKRRGIIAIEPKVGGRLFERFDGDDGPKVFETGKVLTWQPPTRLTFQWRAVNFAPTEVTEVDVVFHAQSNGTLVTVTHSGWDRIRPDHPARHGLQTGPFLRMMGMWWGELMTSLRVFATRKI